MAGSALAPVQTGLYSTLVADATLAALVSGVFDSVPDQTPFPYVQIGDPTEIPWRKFGRNGKEITWTLHAFSRYAGYAEVSNIAARVVDVLEAGFPVAGWELVSCLSDDTSLSTDPDGVTRHAVIRVRLFVAEVA